MNLLLQRTECCLDGVFGQLLDESGMVVGSTLEHAYQDGAVWLAKIPAGTYTCVRGPHRLHGMTEDFETFEITGVEGHAGLLFHWGNFNRDSEGCVLLGHTRQGDMITGSRDEFTKFMALQSGLNSFQLTVEE